MLLSIKHLSKKWLIASFLFVCLVSVGIYLVHLINLSKTTLPTKKGVAGQFFKLPMSFESNAGQTDAAVKYLTRGQDYVLYFTSNAIVMSLQRGSKDRSVPASFLKMQFVEANQNPILNGIEERTNKSNYFIGNDPEQWHTDIPNYAKVLYQNLYPGIDALFYGNPQQLEYDICVAPKGRVDDVRLHIEGSKELFIDKEGNLHILTEVEEVQMQKPFVYQIINGEKNSIEGNFVLLAQNEIGFSLGKYDVNTLLVIDPVLNYSTYLGGSGDDIGTGIAVDSSGSAYIVGHTSSLNFPTMNAYQPTNHGNTNVFVTKFNPAGTALVYSTYLGGTGVDFGESIAVDSSGNAYVTGVAGSNFPTTPGAFQTTNQGFNDAFVTKLAPAGNSLVYSTYLGGSNNDSANAIAVDSSGNAYVTGPTNSSNFPTTPGAFQTTLNGAFNVFVTKLNPTGTALIYSTYLGGSGTDDSFGIALDNSGNAYVCGSTTSPNFPTANAFQPSLSSGLNAFVTKFNPAGTALVYSTYLGGSANNQSIRIAVDSSGNAYTTGNTSSSDFPILNPFQSTFSGVMDAFVTKFNPTGSLVYSTYLGGSNSDNGNGIAVDGSGSAYVVGTTSSTNFPTMDPIQPILAGDLNVFVTKLNPAGNALVFSTYLGGSNIDDGDFIALDGDGNAYITGETSSANFPTVNPFQPNLAGTTNAFVAKIEFEAPSPLPPSNFHGIVKKIKCSSSETEHLLTARWDGSPSQDVIFYRIYKHGKVVDQIFAGSPLVFKKHIKSKHSAKDYEIAAVNSSYLESSRIKIKIVKPQKEKSEQK